MDFEIMVRFQLSILTS